MCAAAVIASSACVKQLPPAPMPPPVVPAVSVAGPPAQGHGRLIVDVPAGPTPVYRIRFEPRPQDNSPRRQTFRFFELPPELACQSTPCVIDEPPGNILLGFPVVGCREGAEYELVNVGLDPSVYSRTLSVFEDETGAERIAGIVSTSIGAAAAITGIALLPAGLSKDNDRLAAAGGITLGAGALLLTVGILMIRHDSASYRPGAANHFGAPALGGATGSPAVAPRRSPLDTPSWDCVWTTRRSGAG